MNKIKLPGLKQPVSIETIFCVQGTGNYSILRFDTGREYLAAETIMRFEEQLTGFVRVHKRWLINPLFIILFEQQSSKEAQVTLRDGTIIPIARRRIEAVKVKIAYTPGTIKQVIIGDTSLEKQHSR